MITQVKNVPLLKVGAYPNRQVDLSLLEKIAGSFNPELLDPTVTDEQGLYGIIVAVNIVGDTLLADLALTSIPAWGVVTPCYAAAEVAFLPQVKDVMLTGAYLTTDPSFVGQAPINQCWFIIKPLCNSEAENLKNMNVRSDTFRRCYAEEGQCAGTIQGTGDNDFIPVMEMRVMNGGLETRVKLNGEIVSSINPSGTYASKGHFGLSALSLIHEYHIQFYECIAHALLSDRNIQPATKA